MQKFGIKYPITGDNDESYLDLNSDFIKHKESEMLHLILTTKKTKLRDPDFGTNLINYIFSEGDSLTESEILEDVQESVKKYIENIEVNKINIFQHEDDEHKKVLSIDYSVILGPYKQNNNIKLNL